MIATILISFLLSTREAKPIEVKPIEVKPIDVKPFRVSPKGLEMIKTFEGLRLRAYRCAGGQLTIGYGHTIKKGEPLIISKKQAEIYLRNDLAYFEKLVSRSVKVQITQHTFDALVSFAFNVGGGAFLRSSVLQKINSYDKIGGCNSLNFWVYAKGRKLDGLVNRRAIERGLCLQQN